MTPLVNMIYKVWIVNQYPMNRHWLIIPLPTLPLLKLKSLSLFSIPWLWRQPPTVAMWAVFGLVWSEWPIPRKNKMSYYFKNWDKLCGESIQSNQFWMYILNFSSHCWVSETYQFWNYFRLVELKVKFHFQHIHVWIIGQWQWGGGQVKTQLMGANKQTN